MDDRRSRTDGEGGSPAGPPAPDDPWTHASAAPDGVDLHYVAAGSGPLLVVLHGFPQHWRAWHRQLRPLADAGYRVVAPDLRGYNRSGRPSGVGAYRLGHLVADVAGLVRHLRATDDAVADAPVAVAGHDWGGVLAWRLPVERPGAVDRVAVLNAPHFGPLRRVARRPRRALRFWYVAAFQVPRLPEAALRARDYALVRRAMATGDFEPAEVERTVRALDRPGAPTAAVNYYRALRYDAAGLLRDPGTLEVPALVTWGDRDRVLRPWLLEGLDRWVPDLRVERFPDASHWVLADAPARVVEVLVDFLSE